jgi:predicted phosphoribosyltransferase
MRIAFDIDDTLYKVSDDRKRQVPDYELIQVLRWFYNNGNTILVWSAGGIDYAQQIVDKLGLTLMVTVIRKGAADDSRGVIDICFDDETVTNGIVNVKVKRPDYNAETKAVFNKDINLLKDDKDK